MGIIKLSNTSSRTIDPESIVDFEPESISPFTQLLNRCTANKRQTAFISITCTMTIITGFIALRNNNEISHGLFRLSLCISTIGYSVFACSRIIPRLIGKLKV